MGRWWRSLGRGDKISITSVFVAVVGIVIPTWLALRPNNQGGPPDTAVEAPTTLASTTTVSDTPDSTSSTTEASTAASGTATKYLSWGQSTTDSQQVPWFAGFADDKGPQEINGTLYPQNVTFGYECASNYDKYADYNLGRHYERFQAVIGPGDTTTQSYHFEIWRDDERAFSATMRHGQSRKIDLPVKNVLKLRVGACATGPQLIGMWGGVYGDARVTGKASEVPPPTTG
jgi:hypothetical protein